MTTWEEIRDEVVGMLADGEPLEDVLAKLEKRKNEMAKANLIAVFDELKKPKQMTNEEWFASLSTKEKAKWMFRLTYKCYWCGREYDKTKKYNEKECPFHKCLDDSKGFEKWLKQIHQPIP